MNKQDMGIARYVCICEHLGLRMEFSHYVPPTVHLVISMRVLHPIY